MNPTCPRLLAVAAVVLTAAACGTSASGGGGQGSSNGAALNGSARSLVVPSTLSTPAFAGIQAEVVDFAALADSNAATVPTLASTEVFSAASSCMEAGCSFNVANVSLDGAREGVFVRLSVTDSFTAGEWQPAYTLIANPNQVQTVQMAGGGGLLGSFVPATLPSVATVANLATLAGISAEELLARGATLAYIGQDRSSGDTRGAGATNAYVTLANPVDGSIVCYPDSTYRRVQNDGSNGDGAVLLVGPPQTAASAVPASYAYPVNVQAAGSGRIYVNNYVFFRPGALVLTTLLPQR